MEKLFTVSVNAKLNTERTDKNHLSVSVHGYMIQLYKYLLKWKLCRGNVCSALLHLFKQASSQFLSHTNTKDKMCWGRS